MAVLLNTATTLHNVEGRQLRTCQDCGAVWESDVRLCEVCGSPLTEEASSLAYGPNEEAHGNRVAALPGPRPEQALAAFPSEEYRYGRWGLLSGVLAVVLGMLIPFLGFVLGFIAVYFGLKAVLHDPASGFLAIILGATGFLVTIYWIPLTLTALTLAIG